MVGTFEQLIHSAAGEIADILYRDLPDSFEKAWVYAEIEGRSGDVACFFTVQSEPGKALRLQDNDSIVDLFFSFDRLRNTMKKSGEDPWSTAAMMFTANGEFNIELGYEDLACLVEQGNTSVDRRSQYMSKFLSELTTEVE